MAQLEIQLQNHKATSPWIFKKTATDEQEEGTEPHVMEGIFGK